MPKLTFVVQIGANVLAACFFIDLPDLRGAEKSGSSPCRCARRSASQLRREPAGNSETDNAKKTWPAVACIGDRRRQFAGQALTVTIANDKHPRAGGDASLKR